MTIYTKFGVPITPLFKADEDGWIPMTVHYPDGGDEPREYNLSDLRADDGLKEINEALENLPDHPGKEAWDSN